MKYPVFFIMVMAFSVSAFAQKDDAASGSNTAQNNIKLNLFALTGKTFSLQYERESGAHTSVSLGLRLQPKTSVPYQGFLENQLNLQSTDTAAKSFLHNARVSNWAITPEFRYYFGKKPLNGFYIAPFARFGGYSVDWNYAFQKNDGSIQDIGFKGNAFAYTFGILLGAQWHLNKNILIDWWILGPSYGGANLTLDAHTDLSGMSAEDQQTLHDNITGVSVYDHHLTATVNNSGVSASGHFPFAGLRTGLCIGFCF